MRNYRFVALAGASLFAVVGAAGSAWAQDKAPDTPPQAAAAAPDDQVIIVNARRREEAALDVPQTVTAVSGKQLQEFSATKFQDIASLVSGLTLETQQLGFGATASTRGVTFQVTSQGSPTVEQYLNEVSVEPNAMAQSNFDIGDVEVLKGPQGTLRGRSAPSGAITETTRRPDLQEIGGYASSEITTLNGLNVQGALGIPLIKDVLGIRVAGVWDMDDYNGVRPATNDSKYSSDPRQRTWSGRVSVRFEPSSNFSANVMYQRVEDDEHTWGGILFGSGAAGIASTPGLPANTRAATSVACNTPSLFVLNCGNPAVFAPPGFNGPVLAASQYESVQDFPDITHQALDIITGQADWRFAGQKLSFVGGYQHFLDQTGGDTDGSNTVVGRMRKFSYGTNSVEDRQSYELRLASDEPLFDGLLDYTVGGYYQRLYGNSTAEGSNAILMYGAFGSPLGAGTLTGGGSAPGLLSPYTYDPRYTTGYNIVTPRNEVEKSFFGSFTLHLFGDSTEFTAGGRQIFKSNSKEVDVLDEPGLAAVVNPNGLGPCPATLTGTASTAYQTGGGTVPAGTPVVGQTYPGTCDVRVDIGANNGAIPGVGAPTLLFPPIPFGTTKNSPFVYNFSLSHKFTPNLNVYATYGTAWRAGPGPITAAPACASSALCAQYNFLNPENSRSIEVGVKASLFDHRLNLAVAGYHETYSGLFVLGSGATYLPIGCSAGLSATCVSTSNISTGGFTFNAPVISYGVDLDASFRVSNDFNGGLLFSWSHGRYNNAKIPCRDTNLDGIADTGTLPTIGQWMALNGPAGPSLCVNNGSSTTAPPWNVSGHFEYSHDVFNDSFGGKAFFRGLVNYYPRNTDIDPTVAGIIPKAYALVNLWVGVRGKRGDWELSLSAKNLFDNKTVLSQGIQQGSLITPQRSDGFGTPATATIPSGYTSITFVQRREFALNLRYAFGSR